MDILLKSPETLTPRLLFELYVHKENLKRTLCQGIFSNMQDIAIAKLRRRKQRDEGTSGLEKKKAYTLKTSFSTIHDRQIDNFKFREFIEILNMMDELLLGDNSNNKKRRRWNDSERLSKPIYDEVEAQRIKDVLAEREEKRNFAKEQGEKYIEDAKTDRYCSKKYIANIDDVTRELLLWAVLSGRDDKIKQIIAEEKRPLKLFIAVAVMCRKCAPLCKEYGLNGKKGEYEEWAEEYENKATELLGKISQENGELALLLIRRRLHIYGRRSMVDVANYGGLRNLMASEPIQELITKMWFGGLEPEGRWGPLFAAWLLPPIAPFMLPPANDIHVDYDAPMFSWSTLTTEADSSTISTPADLSYFKKLVIFMTAPYTAYFYNFFFYLIFLCFFAYVIMRRFCLRPEWQEYLVVITLVAVTLERIRKFAATRGMTNRQKIKGLANDGWNLIYMMSFFIMLFGVIFRFIAYTFADEDLKKEYYGSDARFISEVEKCPPRIVGAQFYTNSKLTLGSSSFQLDIFVKWAHICYCVSFFLMFCGMLNFYNINKLLGPLAISLAEMINDFYQFLYLIIIFMVGYGVMMQSLLYPNETRVEKVFNQLWFKPYMSLFGEMFKPETATYAFDSVDSCEPSGSVMMVPGPEYVYNAGGVSLIYQSKEWRKFTIKSQLDETHPLNGLEWYRPNHWFNINTTGGADDGTTCQSDKWDATMEQTKFCAPTVIHGLLEIQKVRDKFKAQNIQLTYAESTKIGIPFNLKCDQKEGDPYYDKNCDNSKVITNEELREDIRTGAGRFPKLFVPTGDKTVFDPNFIRCPERYWFNSIILIVYMMFAVIMLVNLLVAMFATTYSRITESSTEIWKYNRYELVMDFYNNPAKPCTPPLILLWDVYWILKKVVLKFVIKDEKSNKEILHPRVLGQHPLRLPPDYLPERSYNDIFNAIEKLEAQIWQEMEDEEPPEIAELEDKIKQLRFRVQTLTKVTQIKKQ